MRRILVTYALPYANGHIHIGHLVGTMQTDIWVRFQKLRGRRCIYICGDDTHGTAIMIRARQEGVSEEQLIAQMQQAHEADFAGFDIEFDNYGSTNSPETRQACDEIWAEIRKAGLVEEREVTQLYDAQAGTFLADRFVKGTCPKCKSPGQYGDSCDKCGCPLQPHRTDRPGEHALGHASRKSARPTTCSSTSRSCTDFSKSGPSAANIFSPKSPTT